MSSFTTLRRGALLAAAAGAVAVPTAAQAQTTLATDTGSPIVAAHGTTKVWSARDPATGAFRLVSLTGDAVTALPVAPFDHPVEVALGTGADGSTDAVYTRAGRVVRLDLATGTETTLRALGTHAAQPTLAGGRVAFVRTAHGRAELRLGSRLLTAISRTEGTIADPQLSARRIAYTVIKGSVRSIHVRALRSGTVRSIYRAASGGANVADTTRPSWTQGGRALVWARTNMGSGTGNRFVRWSVATGRLSYAQGTGRAFSTSWISDAEGLLVGEAVPEVGCFDNVEDPPEATQCRVVTTGPLSFTASRGAAGR